MLYHEYFTKISYRNQPFTKMFPYTGLTHHSYSILVSVSSLVHSRMRRYVPSYLTRHGRGFHPGTRAQFLLFLWDVSAPQADDIISNEKPLQFELIFYANLEQKMRIVVA